MSTPKLKPLSEQVIVITGASSGIGLATAQLAAEKGAKVVLASRNETALDRICRDINDKGGTASYVVADVGDRGDVEKIAHITLQRFGEFDTWVNDAGTSAFGRLDEISDQDNKRLFDTNFWGVVYGSLTALEHLKKNGGTIINLGSEVSDAASPMLGMYSASKHAVKGFTNALRMEVEEQKLPISITLIKPAAIATPFFEHSKNYTDHEFRAPPPVYAPQEVARAILHSAVHSTRELYIGSGSKIAAGLYAHMPKLYEWFSEKFMVKAQRGEGPAIAHNDNLYKPGDDGNINGRNENTQQGRASVYTRVSLHPVATVAAVAGIGLALFALIKGGPARKGLLSAAAAVIPALDSGTTRKKIEYYFDRVKKRAA